MRVGKCNITTQPNPTVLHHVKPVPRVHKNKWHTLAKRPSWLVLCNPINEFKWNEVKLPCTRQTIQEVGLVWLMPNHCHSPLSLCVCSTNSHMLLHLQSNYHQHCDKNLNRSKQLGKQPTCGIWLKLTVDATRIEPLTQCTLHVIHSTTSQTGTPATTITATVTTTSTVILTLPVLRPDQSGHWS